VALYEEPDVLVKVIRDLFNEDFANLIVSGEEAWTTINEYVNSVAPELVSKLTKYEPPELSGGQPGPDVFAVHRIDEQLAKAMDRKVWLPSGGTLVIDRTEAMTVVDVNTGKFTGQGGNLEETVTRNNLEAAEEIVRQLRLRDVGGIVVIDFIDMVLESNRELVLRRLLECLARDRTKHQVAEVTSLGLVQMTRKRVGAGLLEAFSQPCECCNGRGVILTLETAEPSHRASAGTGLAGGRRPVPAPPAPGNGGSGKEAGYGAGRRSRNRDDGRRDDAPRDDAPRDDDSAVGATAALAETEAVTAETTPAETTPAGAAAPQASAIPLDNGRRTRAGSAVARVSAVRVEDSEPLVPVVTTAAPAPAYTPVVTGDPADPTARRTRAGSAVARVAVVTGDPAPATEAATEAEATAAPGPAVSEPAEGAEATEAPAPAWAAPAAEVTPEPAPAAADPELVPASLFDPPVPEPAPAEAEGEAPTDPAQPAEASASAGAEGQQAPEAEGEAPFGWA